MSDENNVAVDNSNTTEEAQPNGADGTEETSQDTSSEETMEQVKARNSKLEELANNYKVRAEKAEKLVKRSQPEDKKSSDMSSKDILALTRANVSDDDIDEVLDYAKYKKIPVSEALKSGVLKTMLKDREEQRKVAQATNTGTARRGSTKLSDDEVLDKASKGELPDDPALLVKARWNLKKGKK